MSKEISDEEKLKKFITLVHEQKSRFSSISAGLEHAIEVLIATYFIIDDKDYQDFANIVFHKDNEISFNKKIKMLERFLSRIFPQFLIDNPDFINRFNRFRKLRNKFAHAINLTSEEMKQFVGKSYFELGFIEDGVPKQEQFTFQDIDNRLKDARNLLEDIKKLFRQVTVARIEKMTRFIPKSENNSSLWDKD